MEGHWYYSVESKPVGPLTFIQLTVALSGLTDPHGVLVWHAGFDRWREARDVPEILAIMPDLAVPPPIQAELSTQRGVSETEPTRQGRTQKSSWRKTARAVLSVLIFGISFSVVREVTRSTSTPKVDLASNIAGPARESFTKAANETCLKKQESDPDSKALRLSRETLISYCSCFVDALANSTTYGDLKSYPKEGAIPPEMQAKIEKASPPCMEELQRKLMGAGAR